MTPGSPTHVRRAAIARHGRSDAQAYIEAVAHLARYYARSPDKVSPGEEQAYLLHLLRERKLARSSVNQYGCAYRFFYGTVLGLDGQVFQIPLAAALLIDPSSRALPAPPAAYRRDDDHLVWGCVGLGAAS